MSQNTDNLAAEAEYLCLVFPGAEADGGIPIAQRTYWPCAAGAVIARAGAATAEMLAARRPQALRKAAVRLGLGAQWDPTGTCIVAKSAGHVVIKDGGIFVEDSLELYDDVDATGGAIDFPGPMIMHRN